LPQITTDPDRAEVSAGLSGEDVELELAGLPEVCCLLAACLGGLVALGSIAPAEILLPNASRDAEKKAPLAVVGRFDCFG
jgi:hypothetical protein